MNAKDDPRQELASVAASLRAYLEWQVDTGASGIPRGKRKPAAAIEPSAPAAMETRGQGEREAVTSTAASAPVRVLSATPTTRTEVAAPVMHQATYEAPREATYETPPEIAREMTREASSPNARESVAVTGEDAGARLPILAAEVAGCTKCALSKTRTQTVFSRGNPSAAICFVGEAPGADEDAQGLPFVGRAGQLLDKMISAMGLSPENDVYVCNIIKCRPPENRKPEADEMETCIPYLHEQLALVNPKVIVAMGNTAVQALLQTKMGITKVRGSWKLYKGSTLVMPTYHPSYLLRPSAQQAEAKRQAWDDLQAVMKELKLPIPAKKG